MVPSSAFAARAANNANPAWDIRPKNPRLVSVARRSVSEPSRASLFIALNPLPLVSPSHCSPPWNHSGRCDHFARAAQVPADYLLVP